jgi:ATP-dependent Clp protease ATP-binding subunit ClpA
VTYSAGNPYSFTPRAQQVLALARKEAERFHHHFVGTEHVLLGLIRLGQGTAVDVLNRMGLDLDKVREEVERQVGTGPDLRMVGLPPYTPRVKKILALAAKEARALHHTFVGTEHILLGLLRDGDGVAARVLKNFEVDVEKTREEILKELDPNYAASAAAKESSPAAPDSQPPNPGSSRTTSATSTQRCAVDILKRYDVYCSERDREIVVYRNVLFKGTQMLLPRNQHDVFTEFVELEQAQGGTVFVARVSIVKFCEHGVTPAADVVPSEHP